MQWTGPYGINHGVELHADVVSYGQERLEHFKKNSSAIDAFTFCDPQFVQGEFCSLKKIYVTLLISVIMTWFWTIRYPYFYLIVWVLIYVICVIHSYMCHSFIYMSFIHICHLFIYVIHSYVSFFHICHSLIHVSFIHMCQFIRVSFINWLLQLSFFFQVIVYACPLICACMIECIVEPHVQKVMKTIWRDL